MPMFQIDLERRESAEKPTSPTMASQPDQGQEDREDSTLRRKQSEESISTELCEGPISDIPAPQTPERNPPTECSDRSELIERLKRGESPTWKPNRHFESIWGQQPVSPTRSPKRSNAGSPTLLPPAPITPEKKSPDSDDERRRREGLSIERPRSALHSGDFTQDELSGDASPVQDGQQAPKRQDFSGIGDSWFATSPPRDFTPFQFERREISTRRPDQAPGLSSLSSSISSSFVYKPPTSPLVQSESNEDIDLTSPMDGIDISSSLPRNPRRHTFMSPHSASYGMPHSPSPMQPSHLRPERSFPYQAHQPRRSLASTPNFPTTSSSPQTPALLRPRRPSYSSDVSPIQHASMVGSYEESILRGRMSTTPSKPLDFLAQIGVLGLGKCKSSLRCPPHVTLPFPAVFYSYGSSSQGHPKVEDGPSPYVGQIDLENGLPNQGDDARSKRKIQSRTQERLPAEDNGAEANRRSVEPSDRDTRKTQRPKRRSSSPRAPPGGSYRIPEKGQIQIIIKNPNKTAVKLFLVPYDLAGMEPGTKTFIRQRSYSAGPIIENMPLKDNGTGDRPILRYLVHLHICCPSRGRYFLYKSIRVVFANRVPDGKEKLRNEITLPEPRFTTYKSIRVMHPPISGGTGPGASLAADKAFRRRSSGFYFVGPNQQVYDAAHGLHSANVSHQSYSSDFGGLNTPVEPVPLMHNGPRDTVDEGSNLGFSDPQSPNSSQTSRPNTQNSNDVSSWSSLDGQINRYDKLNKGDVGYGGNPFAHLINGNTGVAESLLSQRLRSLGVQGQGQASQESDTMQE
ncbi:uncharacterized protein F4807DRAFT_406711 [Annulohypoxylon truncatum]|uniref:uncharacterized protein n=1 Tax=Annulohypoxylon truncatum TaxID=327061 RepID=UPI0020083715|nr:uncharacterized protein F4807DRAFT_406711 [Annulohypoxylon truncatum]KAI1214116.1 hypothetical protein F4807DRAFT_406711 [Annulohypoxylon truncatum]